MSRYSFSPPTGQYDPFLDHEAPLRKGSSGERVHSLQRDLRYAGYTHLQESGIFDEATESAVRSFQRHHYMSPDGVVTGRVLRSLITAGASQHFRYDPLLLYNPNIQRIVAGPFNILVNRANALPPSAMTTSYEGRKMMLFNETGGDYKSTAYVHFPGGKSGVTLGPGYDMKDRDRAPIQHDLESIGIDSKIAAQISAASHLYDDDARDFADRYGRRSKAPLICLTEKQQVQLMARYLPVYEQKVKTYVYIPLLQREFDALVSFVVNPGGPISTVTTAINQGRTSDALEEIMRRIGTVEGLKKGLIRRRRREVEFFLTGSYKD